ncbi:uncharacterized protein LOC5499458 [Nematostella vectensis]|uniref:uncharacterized protein LOC5499458 n=1 Tax=Nematostella vectensis TaxID=45351 RepID=UPI0020771741|nr:uncharacterized protein LOC5499458 [Nematostella vectensis]
MDELAVKAYGCPLSLECRPKTVYDVTRISNDSGLFDALNGTSSTDFVFPVVAKQGIQKVYNKLFIGLLEHPGSMLLVIPGQQDPVQTCLETILSSWPLLALSIICTSMAGMAMWVFESLGNSEEFPRDFAKGWWEGFWWAFISMTTVGDYAIFRKDRQDINPGGGVFIAVYNTIIATRQTQLDCQAEAIWIKIEIANQKPLYLASLYRPPGNDEKPLEAFKQSLNRLQSNGSFPRIIIAGDMNVPDIEWSNASVKDNPQYGVAVNKTMIDLVDDHSLSQLVTFPTRQESVLDLVLTSHPDLVHSLSSVQGISDHSAVSFDLNLSVKVNKKKPRIVYKFAKANFTDIRKDATILSNDFFERHPENINVESNWQFFKSGLMNILSRSVPTKKSGSWNNSPWMTRDLKTSLRKKKRLYNNYKKSGKACDKEKYRKFQKLFKIKMKKAQDEYIADTLNSDLKEKPKKFWSYIKSKRQDQVGVPPLKEHGIVKTDSMSKAEILSNQFQQVFTQEDVASISSKGHGEIPMMGSISFNRDGVEKLLKTLNSKKASGPDKIPTTLLKETASEIADVVTFLFNQSYSSGQLPEDWTKAQVVPIFKKGVKHDPCNYRPVSLTTVLCKLMEHVIYKNIMEHLENNNILFANQHGFRKNHSCETQLLLTVEDLARNTDNGGQIDMLILDFSKAFDKVAHGRLISKLLYYGIQGRTLAWIKSWLTNRTQRVVVDGVSSKPVDVTSGVPQGTVLGPLMFLLFINDMQENLECTLRLFADDALLYYQITHDDDTLVLQRDLDRTGSSGQDRSSPATCGEIHKAGLRLEL